MAVGDEAVPKDLLNKIKDINNISVELNKAWKEYTQSYNEIQDKYPNSAEFETYDKTNKAQLGIMISKVISIFGGDVESFNKHTAALMPAALSMAVDQMEDVPKESMNRINKKACGNIIKNALFDIDEYNGARNGDDFEEDESVPMEDDEEDFDPIE
uniref:Phage protein n=1 Tax=Strongyloides papillosus TaxID=174720 RepID=A0A0N5CAP7_STREA